MRITQFILAATVSIFLASNLAYGKQDLPENVRIQTQKRIDLGYHLSTVIGVIDKNGTRFYNFGQMSLSDKTVPDENSIFEIASVTKTFTATLLADLEAKGKMSIHDAIADHIPQFENVFGAPEPQIKLLDLINHTAGLPRNPTNTDNEDNNRYANYSVGNLNDFLSTLSLKAKPTGRMYTNTGAVILEHAIETTIKDSYENLIEKRVLNTLSMDDSHFIVPGEKRNRLVTGYRLGKETREVNVGQWNAMGGLKSTAKDMLSFIGAQIDLNPSPLNDAIQLTHKEQYRDDKDIEALGWHIKANKVSGKSIHYHNGGTDGFVSFAGFNLEDQIGVVILINGTRWWSDLGFHLLDPTNAVRNIEEKAY